MNLKKTRVVPKHLIVPFILITSIFSLWGFANDITNPMVAAFKTVLELTNFKSALVQLAFYGGYFTMAIPAALFARKYSYKGGVLIGLALYSVGALLFYPAAKMENFSFFLIALYVLTFGLAFLETTCNPYILSMGDEETATRRLNLAQAFNPIGSILGMIIASKFILAALQSDDHTPEAYATLDAAQKASITTHDLGIISTPYIILGCVIILMFVAILILKMPQSQDKDKSSALKIFGRLIRNKRYREGVIAQVFYVAAQIMCWTFIIHYAGQLDIPKDRAQNFNILAMGIFISFRFIGTVAMKYIKPAKLLLVFAIAGIITTSGVVLINGYIGLGCLIATSAFMSIMFPTIYGIALDGLGEDAKLGAAGLVMAIVGGAVMPPLQGKLIDLGIEGRIGIGNIPAENFSFILPFICFIMITIYAYRVVKDTKN